MELEVDKYHQSQKALELEVDKFNQLKNKPPPVLGLHVDGNFIPQRPRITSLAYADTGFTQIPARKKNYTLGGLGRRRLAGAASDTAWDFLTTSFFKQPSGGASGRQVGEFGGMRGLLQTRAVDIHGNPIINNWKRAIYDWVRGGVGGSWNQRTMRTKWNEFKKFVLDGGNAAISGDPPKGWSNILQAYMLMCAQGHYRSMLIRDKSPNVKNITRDEADTLGISSKSSVSSDEPVEARNFDQGSRIFASESEEPPKKKARTETTHEDTIVLDSDMDMLETSSSHSKSAIADRLNRVVRNVNYKERGSAGFHTDSLEFANSSERDRWVEEHRAPNEAVSRGWGYNIDIANYGDKDPATWIGPVIKRGAPIVRLITHGHARGMQFNANALRAESLENMRLGSHVLAKKKPAQVIFGEGSPSEQKDGWYQVYVGLDCAYQRCWQESQQRGQEPWTVLGRIPNTVDHNQHVFCEEYRQGHVLPIMLARWPNQIMNMPFDNNVATEFYNLVTDEEFSFSGKSYASLMELMRAELKVGERAGVDMYKTFGAGINSDVQNIGNYITGGFMVLSPIDILCCQDQLSGTNWLAYFSKFNEMSQDSETPHWMQPWLFCLRRRRPR